MNQFSEQNKAAWEYNAYDFWVNRNGAPYEGENHV